jgi:myosin-3
MHKYIHTSIVFQAPNRNLEAKILEVNHILEAFGNAETGMNRNSSRFGKYFNVTFTRTGKITGAEISAYLLEESRVDQQEVYEFVLH